MILRSNYQSLRILSIVIATSMFCQLSSKVATNFNEENQNGYKASNLNLNLLRDYQAEKIESIHNKREQDKLNRRSDTLKKFLPRSYGVKRQGQAVFVSSKLLHANVESIQDILRGTKLIPHRQSNGHIAGYSIKSTKRGSFISLLGFQAGDVIRRVNQFDIVSMSMIFKAYRRIFKNKPEKVVVIYSPKDMPNVKQRLTFFKVDVNG